MLNFAMFAKRHLADSHQPVIADLCLLLKNCADCHDECRGCTVCDPVSQIGPTLFHVTRNSFCLEMFSPRVNNEIIAVLKKYGYQSGIVSDNTRSWIKAWK